MSLFLILMLLACLCFVLDAFGVSARVSLLAVGLALMALAFALGDRLT